MKKEICRFSLGYCRCGCGTAIPIRKKEGFLYRYKRGHVNPKEENNPWWKDGTRFSSHGYVLKRAVGHPKASKEGKYVYEHILVMEKHLGRYLEKGESVHHINHDKEDNRIENLKLTRSQKEHMSYHEADRKKERENWKCVICRVHEHRKWGFLNHDKTKPLCINCQSRLNRQKNLEKHRTYEREYSRRIRALKKANG